MPACNANFNRLEVRKPGRQKNPGKEQAKKRSRGKQGGYSGYSETDRANYGTSGQKYSIRLTQSGRMFLQSCGLNTGEYRCVRWD